MVISNIIDAKTLKKLLVYGCKNLHKNVKEVNELNVFPIPDGDTGDNMYLTIKGGLDAIVQYDGDIVGELTKLFANGMLLNARGNSGVILSQLFFGLAEGLKGKTTATLSEFTFAMEEGVKCAYNSVSNPVEGTILTVARESATNMREKHGNDKEIREFFTDVLEEMKNSLEHTPDLLFKLKEAGVIDSGGAGLVYIIEGFCKAIFDEEMEDDIAITVDNKTSVDLSKFNENSVMEFGYCTEFLLQLQNIKTNPNEFSVDNLVQFLNSVGESVVAFKTGTIVKVHVHTMEPWKVLKHCQTFGEFLTLKIENMTLQHNNVEKEKNEKLSTKVKRARKSFATITVANGEGLKETFYELGADYVIDGGQTNNPSAEEFINAFEEVNADHIFVLPNNKNIILSAKQASKMYEDSDVRVIESKSIGDGYSILSMLDYTSENADIIEQNMNSDMENTMTGMITTAIRDTTVNGIEIKEGDYIGFKNGQMLVSNKDKLFSATYLAKTLSDGHEFLIVAYGKGASEQEREEFKKYVNEKIGGVEFYEIDGGQSVYDFILIVE